MYLRWSERRGFDVEMAEASAGEEAGLKSATFIARGENAYGLFAAERGVHRLVRISPFDSSGAPPHELRPGRRRPAGRGRRRGRDRRGRPAHRHLPRLRRRRPARQQDRLGGADHPHPDRHRRPVPERALADPEQGGRDAAAEIEADRAGGAQTRRRAGEGARRGQRRRLGLADPLLRPAPVHDGQGPPHRARGRRRPAGARRRHRRASSASTSRKPPPPRRAREAARRRRCRSSSPSNGPRQAIPRACWCSTTGAAPTRTTCSGSPTRSTRSGACGWSPRAGRCRCPAGRATTGTWCRGSATRTGRASTPPGRRSPSSTTGSGRSPGSGPSAPSSAGFSMGAVMSHAMALERRAAGGGRRARLQRLHADRAGWRPTFEDRSHDPRLRRPRRPDPVIEIGFGRAARDLLVAGGIEVTYRESDVVHTIDPADVPVAAEWLVGGFRLCVGSGPQAGARSTRDARRLSERPSHPRPWLAVAVGETAEV